MNAQDILTTSGKHPERPRRWPPTRSMITDAGITADRITRVLAAFSASLAPDDHDRLKERELSSGYRPSDVNAATPGAAPNSHHMKCEAGDVEDYDMRFAAFCMANQHVLEENELWAEDPRYTRTILPGESKALPNGQEGWFHLQIVPPASGHRVFIPYSTPPP